MQSSAESPSTRLPEAIRTDPYHRLVPVVDDPIVIRLRDVRRTRVRYGRAVLTIARFGGLSGSELERSLAGYEAGDVEAEAVCWAFVRERVIDHTPSFNWADVELPLLLDRVVGVSTRPEFSSSEPEEVAAELVDALHEQREAAERARQRTHLLVQQVTGQFNLGARLRETLGGFTVGGSVFGKVGVSSVLDQYFKGTLVSQAPSDTAKQIAMRSGLQGQVAEISRAMGASPAITGLGKSLIADVTPLTGFGLKLAGKDWGNAFIGANNFAPLAQLPALQGLGKTLSDSYHPTLLKQLVGRVDIFKGIVGVSRDWIELFKRALPVNWRELEYVEVDAVIALMLETGVSLAWVPRTSIVRELLSAKTDRERAGTLEVRSQEILEDVEAVLEEITCPKLRFTAGECQESIDTYRKGHLNPALSYASAILSNLAHGYFDARNFKPVRQEFEGADPLDDDLSYADSAYVTVGRAWVRALDPFDGVDDPWFNRNRTLHVIGDHYSLANLMAALMLLAGLLRELQRFEERESALSTAESGYPAVAVG